MGVGMTPDVIAAATNMINNLNPMAVLQVSWMMKVVITLFDKNDDEKDGITHDDHNLMLLFQGLRSRWGQDRWEELELWER